MEEQKREREGDDHWWMGWPGACCMKCGCEDRVELELAGWKEDLPPVKCSVTDAEHREFLRGLHTDEEIDKRFPWLLKD